MSERDRLIKALIQSFAEQYEKRRLITPQHTADHLIANNVTIPPVTVGQTVYLIRRPTERSAWVDECTVSRVVTYRYDHGGKSCIFDSYNFSAHDKDIGKTVFLTREEAEEALREVKQ